MILASCDMSFCTRSARLFFFPLLQVKFSHCSDEDRQPFGRAHGEAMMSLSKHEPFDEGGCGQAGTKVPLSFIFSDIECKMSRNQKFRAMEAGRVQVFRSVSQVGNLVTMRE